MDSFKFKQCSDDDDIVYTADNHGRIFYVFWESMSQLPIRVSAVRVMNYLNEGRWIKVDEDRNNKVKISNFKVKCVRTISDRFFTEGENYEVVNGKLTGNRGEAWEEYNSVEEINKKFASKFELVLDKTIVLSDKKEDNMRFKKEDLKLFDVVEWRNGKIMLVGEVEFVKYFIGVTTPSHNGLEWYDDLLINVAGTKEYEPVKIYRPTSAYAIRNFFISGTLTDYKLLWEEKQELELTLDEIAEKFGVKVENLKIKK